MSHLPPSYTRAELRNVTSVCDGDVLGMGFDFDGQTARFALSISDAQMLLDALNERLVVHRYLRFRAELQGLDQPRSQSPMSDGIPSREGSNPPEGQGV